MSSALIERLVSENMPIDSAGTVVVKPAVILSVATLTVIPPSPRSSSAWLSVCRKLRSPSKLSFIPRGVTEGAAPGSALKSIEANRSVTMSATEIATWVICPLTVAVVAPSANRRTTRAFSLIAASGPDGCSTDGLPSPRIGEENV